MADVVVIKGAAAKRLKKEAQRLDISPDEYLLDLLTQNLDPADRAKEYLDAAEELLVEARKELGRGDLRQAAEKVWGAAALAVKAYAAWKDEKQIASHKELWEYKSKIAGELGNWVIDSWAHANTMHTCFYEGWCTSEDVEEALARVEKLVKEIRGKLRQS